MTKKENTLVYGGSSGRSRTENPKVEQETPQERNLPGHTLRSGRYSDNSSTAEQETKQEFNSNFDHNEIPPQPSWNYEDDLQGMPLVGRYAERLKRNDPTLKNIDLANNKILDDGVKTIVAALKDNKTLSKIDLSRNGITWIGAEYLASLFNFDKKVIIANESKQVLTFANAHKSNKTLTKISLMGNNIGDRGVNYLSDAIKDNQTLTSINFAGNNITDAGINHLSHAIEANHSITKLNLSNNQISDIGARYLIEALQFNNSIIQIDLTENNISLGLIEEINRKLSYNQKFKNIFSHYNKGINYSSQGDNVEASVEFETALTLAMSLSPNDSAEFRREDLAMLRKKVPNQNHQGEVEEVEEAIIHIPTLAIDQTTNNQQQPSPSVQPGTTINVVESDRLLNTEQKENSGR